jgi:hypothetical protein
MKIHHYMIILCLLCFGMSGNALGAELVKRFSGSESTETLEFEVEAPWLLDWRVNGEYPKLLGIEVSLINAVTGTHEGYILKSKYPGNGVRLFDTGGRYRLRISSTLADWIMKVEQLTRAEAEQYTPVDKSVR